VFGHEVKQTGVHRCPRDSQHLRGEICASVQQRKWDITAARYALDFITKGDQMKPSRVSSFFRFGAVSCYEDKIK
jgi:hypothetical protein